MIHYKLLCKEFKKLHRLKTIGAILDWDSLVNMRTNLESVRKEQMALIEQISSNILLSKGLKENISSVDASTLSFIEQKNYELMKRARQEAIFLQENLGEELEKARQECVKNWRAAKTNTDFSLVCNSFRAVLDITRKYADKKANFHGITKYDALLDRYDHGLREKDLNTLFQSCREEIPTIIKSLTANEKNGEHRSGRKERSSLTQRQLTSILSEIPKVMHFDFARGRIDKSPHPFCWGDSTDVRVTVRDNDDVSIYMIMDLIHELGHALYLQNLPSGLEELPVGQYCSSSIHESQALLFEFYIGRSREFTNYLSNIARKTQVNEDLYDFFNKVSLGSLRIDTDEVSYSLHIVLRHKIEKALLEEEINVEDVPRAWNEEHYKLFGIYPKNDREGCLQDMHWYMGYIGYFPGYLLGAVYASQMFDCMQRDNHKLAADISHGNLGVAVEWLNKSVHNKGRLYNSKELMKKITGEEINVQSYITYIKRKYGV
jgi:carboxypeptidase Taq